MRQVLSRVALRLGIVVLCATAGLSAHAQDYSSLVRRSNALEERTDRVLEALERDYKDNPYRPDPSRWREVMSAATRLDQSAERLEQLCRDRRSRSDIRSEANRLEDRLERTEDLARYSRVGNRVEEALEEVSDQLHQFYDALGRSPIGGYPPSGGIYPPIQNPPVRPEYSFTAARSNARREASQRLRAPVNLLREYSAERTRTYYQFRFGYAGRSSTVGIDRYTGRIIF